jgi:hypothetical protein
MSRSWKGGSTRQWRRIRARVMAENAARGGRCQLAIPDVCTGPVTDVHHTHGRAATGDDPRYLIATCRACNLHVGDPSQSNPQPRSSSRW